MEKVKPLPQVARSATLAEAKAEAMSDLTGHIIDLDRYGLPGPASKELARLTKLLKSFVMAVDAFEKAEIAQG